MRHFSKAEIQMASKYINIVSQQRNANQNQNKAPSHPFSMAALQKQKNKKHWLANGGSVKQYSHARAQFCFRNQK